MRRLILLSLAAAALVLAGVEQGAAQPPSPGNAATISPTSSPSPGARAGDRSRSPGFVILLVLLGLGLLWQLQRSRRTTADVSARSLEDLDVGLRPPDDKRPP